MPKSRFEANCVIADFVLREKIGSGSLGTVYKAIQLSLEREVALKILSPELSSPKFVASFLREARAAAKLSHANLVRAYAVGEYKGVCYLAMNFIKGETLRDKLEREGKIPIDEALHIAQQVAEALFHAWEEAQLIHRDVKPDNIMITDDGTVKLTDLGLAINQSEWTEDMEISGSPSYMSPEQFSGEKLDTRSDIYSLGVSLYQMIAGQLPFDGESFQEVAQQHFNEHAVPLTKIDADVPSKVSAMVAKMMEKLPEDRYENMEILLKNIWSIRQTTAPSQDLVPDVHTISINRLDYDLQKKFQKKKQEADSTVVVRDRRKHRRANPFLIAALACGTLLAVAMLLRSPREDSQCEPEATAEYERSLQNFIARFESPTHHPTILAVEVENFISCLPQPLESPRQESIFWRLHYLKEKLDSAKKEIELKEKLSHIARIEGRMRTELDGKRDVNERMLQDRISLENQLKASQESVATMTRTIETLQAATKEQQGIIAGLNARHDALVKERDMLTLGQFVMTRNFRLAEGYLQYRRTYGDDAHRVWLNRYLAWLKRIELLEGFLAGGGSKVPGRVFDQGKRITMMTSGIIYFEEPSTGVGRSRSVYDFPAVSMYQLARAVRPEIAGRQNNFCADYAFLAGRLESSHIAEGDPCVLEITKAILTERIRSIRILATYDVATARQEAEELRIRFQFSPLSDFLSPLLESIDQ